MRPNGGWSSSGTQNMQSSTGQYSTHAGDPAQPVQHSVITASSLGFFLRGVDSPFDRGSCFSSRGTIAADLIDPDSPAMAGIILSIQAFEPGPPDSRRQPTTTIDVAPSEVLALRYHRNLGDRYLGC